LAQWSAINKTVFDHLNKAIQIQPLEPSYHFHRSIAFLHQGDFLGAISDLETATKVSSNSPFVKRFKAQVQVHYGLKCLDEANYSVAYRLFHSSLDSYPDTTFLKTVIASTCIQLNRYSDGLTLLNQILQPQLQAKKSVPLESLVLRSYIYAHLQQYQASCKDLQLAFEQNPSGTDEMKFMSRYLSTAADRLRYLAFAHVDRQQFQQAFNAIELALDIRPGSRDLIKDRCTYIAYFTILV
jgi:tetratricopeptide (TPR) repeat protein